MNIQTLGKKSDFNKKDMYKSTQWSVFTFDLYQIH